MRVPSWLFLTGVVVLVGLTLLCSVFSFLGTQRLVVDLGNRGVQVDNPFTLARAFLTDRNALSGGTAQQDSFATFIAAQPTMTPTPRPLATTTPATGVVQQAATTPDPTPTLDPLAEIRQWEDPRRFTVLLLGIDQRTGVEDEEKYFRTDTMMVVSIDPVRQRAGVLSIPRDLWVSIPGFSEQRINTANALGDSNAYPGGGGPALAAETVEQNLGIDIDKYVLINFDVFTSVVNLVAPSGVEVCVEEEIDDPYYPDAGYGFIHVHFDEGCQRLDAERLLQFARTRKTAGGDFDRARRQQQVIRALRDEVLSAGGLANFVSQVPALWEELSGSFRTNMTLEEILSIAQLVQEIDQNAIQFGVIDNMAVTFATTSSGDQVLLPNYSAIRTLIQDTFYPPDRAQEASLTLADLRQRAEQEGATVVVFNNTQTAGLAQRTKEWLTSQGVTVAEIGSVPQPDSAATHIRTYSDKPWTARYLAELLGISQDQIRSVPNDGLTTGDVMIAAGPDMENVLSGQ